MAVPDESVRSLLERGLHPCSRGDLDRAAELFASAGERARAEGDGEGELAALLQLAFVVSLIGLARLVIEIVVVVVDVVAGAARRCADRSRELGRRPGSSRCPTITTRGPAHTTGRAETRGTTEVLSLFDQPDSDAPYT